VPSTNPSDRFDEISPDTEVGSSDLSSEQGLIIMRNKDDLLYTLVAIRNPISGIGIGPFVDRNGNNRELG